MVANIWTSARPSSSSGVAPSAGKRAQPIEASISTMPPSTRYGRRSDVAEPSDEGRRLLLGARADREDDELVAADPGDGVARPDDGLEPTRDALQHLVARVVPADVVDLLEAVEVDDHQRERVRRAPRALQRLLDPVVEQALGSAGRSARRGARATRPPGRGRRAGGRRRRRDAARRPRGTITSADDARFAHRCRAGRGRERRRQAAASAAAPKPRGFAHSVWDRLHAASLFSPPATPPLVPAVRSSLTVRSLRGLPSPPHSGEARPSNEGTSPERGQDLGSARAEPRLVMIAESARSPASSSLALVVACFAVFGFSVEALVDALGVRGARRRLRHRSRAPHHPEPDHRAGARRRARRADRRATRPSSGSSPRSLPAASTSSPRSSIRPGSGWVTSSSPRSSGAWLGAPVVVALFAGSILALVPALVILAHAGQGGPQGRDPVRAVPRWRRRDRAVLGATRSSTGGSGRAALLARVSVADGLAGCGMRRGRRRGGDDHAVRRRRIPRSRTRSSTSRRRRSGMRSAAAATRRSSLLDLRRARTALEGYLDAHPPCDEALEEIEATERDAIAPRRGDRHARGRRECRRPISTRAREALVLGAERR